MEQKPALVVLQRFSAFVVACAVFVLVNLGAAFFMRAAADSNGYAEVNRIRAAVMPVPVEKTFMSWTARDWLSRAVAPDVVLMGSSQMASATFSSEAVRFNKTIDCVRHRNVETLAEPLSTIARRPVQVFNWSQSGAMISDDYLIASSLFKAPLVPSIIVIGVSPRDFIDNTLPCIGSTEAFQFFARRADLNEYVAQAFPDFMSRLAWTFDSLPLQQLGQNFKIEMRNLAYARPYGRVWRDDDLIHVEPGKWFVSPAMPPYKDNTVEYRHRYATVNAKGYTRQCVFFDKLLATMHNRGVLVMVVAMPSLAINRELLPQNFWNEWRSDIAAGCDKYKDVSLDLSNSNIFVKDDYLDTVHLNASGGKKLMDAVFAALTANPNTQARLIKQQDAAVADRNFQS